MSIKIAAAAALIAAAAPAPKPVTLAETDTALGGQPLVVPSGPLKVVATRTELKAGAAIGTHMHLWARYVYVERGAVELTLTGSGATRTFRAGEMIVEPIGKWHSGRIVADAVLVATEQVPPGRCNTVRPPADGSSGDC
ncbi:MAG TPA: cupin domain-containing protein [Allosphingosinicella sp.]|jgi:quercetin dioxygenase-like cupin family protein